MLPGLRHHDGGSVMTENLFGPEESLTAGDDHPVRATETNGSGFRRMGRPPTKIERQCVRSGCGAKFLVKPSEIARGSGLYCSRQCRSAGRREGGPEIRAPVEKERRPPPIQLVCEGCKETFNVYRYRAEGARKARFCSCRCKGQAASAAVLEARVESVCANRACGRAFMPDEHARLPADAGQNSYCSPRCRTAAALARTGRRSIWLP